MKIAFITNFCPHYRIKTFETLAKYHDVKYYFFSEGKEWYWRQQYGVYIGQFKYEYLKGFSVAKTESHLIYHYNCLMESMMYI